jgi:hypothetical protein
MSETLSGRNQKRCLVVADAKYGPLFWEDFCREGAAARGLEFIVLCLKPGEDRLYRNASFTDTLNASHILARYGLETPSREALATFAADFETSTGTFISDLLQADRHFGRAYSYAGSRHPQSPLAARATYWDSVALIQRLYEFYLEAFRQHGIGTLLLGGVASLPLKLICVAARRAGLDIRLLATARVGNRLIWVYDEFLAMPHVVARWKQSLSSESVATALDPESLGSYAQTLRSQARLARRFTFAGLLTALGREVKNYTRSVAARLLKRARGKAGRYYFLSSLKNHVNVFTDYRRLRRRWDPTWKHPQKIPYVFLPLHVEPEAALGVLSPEFNTQMGLIDLLVKALPAGTLLVIKEHRAAIGRRPEGFYDWLTALPAAALAPIDASGPELARGSRVTVTITGTAGLEAAVAGVPVLSFGEHNFYNCLPHVHVMRDLAGLRGLLRRLIEAPADRERDRREGRRFFDSLAAVSVDLGEEALTRQRRPPPAAVTRLFDGLWKTLEPQA